MAKDQEGALVAVIADEDTITGFLLAGVGDVDIRKRTNFLVVDNKTTVRQVEQAFKEYSVREDIAIILISQPIANMIRSAVANHAKVRPRAAHAAQAARGHTPDCGEVVVEPVRVQPLNMPARWAEVCMGWRHICAHPAETPACSCHWLSHLPAHMPAAAVHPCCAGDTQQGQPVRSKPGQPAAAREAPARRVLSSSSEQRAEPPSSQQC